MLRRMYLKKMRISTFHFLSSQSFTNIHACPPFQPRGMRLFAHVCGVLCRLGTYLRQLLWYMEVAPKFPRGVVRLLAALFSLSLSLRQPSVFSPRLVLALSTFAFSPLWPASSSLPFYSQPSRVLTSVRAFIWPTCFRIRWWFWLVRRTLEPSPRGIIKIAVRGDGANGFRDITPVKLYTRNNVM